MEAKVNNVQPNSEVELQNNQNISNVHNREQHFVSNQSSQSTEYEDPDETLHNNEGTNTKNNKKSYSRIPRSHIDLLAMGKRVLETWKTKSELVLFWTSSEEFGKLLNEFEKAGDEKSNKKTKRSPVVSMLNNLDKIINKDITYVKQLLSLKFGKEHCQSYYADFGIEYIKNKYIIPTDRQERLKALQKMVAAFDHYNIDIAQHGKQHWSDIKNQYEQLLEQNLEYTQGVSVDAGKKSQLKNQIKEILSGLQNLIKIQYRQQAPFVLREFGFLREHF